MKERSQELDISENECRDVAVLRLYKGFRQRIIKFGRCLLWNFMLPNIQNGIYSNAEIFNN
jgi:hypothetical protein